MSEPSFLSANFSWLVGYGAGAGMALIMVFCGLAMAGVGLGGYGVKIVRDAEILLPDHEVIVEPSGEVHERLQELLVGRQVLITAPVSHEREQELKEVSEKLHGEKVELEKNEAECQDQEKKKGVILAI